MQGGYPKLRETRKLKRRKMFYQQRRMQGKTARKVIGLCLIAAILAIGTVYLATAQENKSYIALRSAVDSSFIKASVLFPFINLSNTLSVELLVEETAEPELTVPFRTASPNESGEAMASDPDATPRIYLTFDDGPSASSTPKILEILDKYSIRATFFVLGSQAESRPEMVKAAADAGHVIANHGYSHDYASVYASPESFMQDAHKCEDILAGILGRPPERILRFIGGTTVSQLEKNPDIRNSIQKTLVDEGWRYFDWNADMYDSVPEPGPEPGVLGSQLNAGIDEKISYGIKDIVVLAHDTNVKVWTPTDLPMIIEHCLSKGYSFEVLTGKSPECVFR